MRDAILSIQSAVAYGHVGNSAAVFPLQRLGIEVWPVNTVLFSNHLGYGAFRGHVVALDEIEAIIKGVEERGVFPRVAAVLSGYLGAAALGEAVLRTVERVRSIRPGALHVCDPVMGDVGGFFVKPGIPELFRDRIVPQADIITPNQFELAYLAGRDVGGVADTRKAAAAVRATGPRLVVVTSVRDPDRPDELSVIADSAEGSWVCTHPRLEVTLNGTGDAFTALLLGWYLRCGSIPEALSRAVSAMYALVDATRIAGSKELELVAAQGHLVEPPRLFPAIPLS
ncbi:MAG: pyridoxal kinase PdxY [Geminicoccaceae bacterium]